MERILPKKKDSGENQHLGQMVQDFVHQHYVCPKRWPKSGRYTSTIHRVLVKFHRDLKHDLWAPKRWWFFVREMGAPKFQGNLGWWNITPFGQIAGNLTQWGAFLIFRGPLTHFLLAKGGQVFWGENSHFLLLQNHENLISHRIHGTSILTYIYLIFWYMQVNIPYIVGICWYGYSIWKKNDFFSIQKWNCSTTYRTITSTKLQLAKSVFRFPIWICCFFSVEFFSMGKFQR